MENKLTIKGVKVHNLKNIDLEIPKSITKAVESLIDLKEIASEPTSWEE